MDTILISFAIASVLLALAPGPDNFFVLTFSAKYGRTLGILTVLGLVCGCFIHTSLVAFGVSALIINNSLLLSILKYIGAIYLLFVAIKVYKSDNKIKDFKDPKYEVNKLKVFINGLLMNMWMNVNYRGHASSVRDQLHTSFKFDIAF